MKPSDIPSPRRRALIVEDEALIAEELRERLLRAGFFVIAAVASAEEGIEIAIREQPDLVLMDIRLRGAKDGIEAAQEIRKRVDLPIVYISAHSDQLTVERAKRTDHDGFIRKPFHRSDLQSTVEIAMKRYAIRVNRQKQ
ncbi:MAG TPA: response regulator [Terriglobales bacterium]|nr:response regulator [Terriglobales bacterium]